jgi:hypothetical protein
MRSDLSKPVFIFSYYSISMVQKIISKTPNATRRIKFGVNVSGGLQGASIPVAG